MTSFSTVPTTASNPKLASKAQTGSGHFILTLCPLDAPVSIRQPKSPQLKSYLFFTSPVRDPDNKEQLYLHMGFFDTLAMAERCADVVRHRYPNAFATLAPNQVLNPVHSATPSLPLGSKPSASQRSDAAGSTDESLTDTQVLKVLESRGEPAFRDSEDSHSAQIAVIRPDDTASRRALKDAVARGAPVSFALQLMWSEQSIDLTRIPELGVFKPHTLYAIESRRDGRRPRHFLRLGFFADAFSAKQVAVELISTFAYAAVVPVTEREVTRARDSAQSSSGIPFLADQRDDCGSATDGTAPTPMQAADLSDASGVARGPDITQKAPVQPAKRDIWAETDSLSQSGVRHMRVEMKEQSSGRWRKLR